MKDWYRIKSALNLYPAIILAESPEHAEILFRAYLAKIVRASKDFESPLLPSEAARFLRKGFKVETYEELKPRAKAFPF